MSVLGKVFGTGVKETAEGIGGLAKDLRTAITGVDPETKGKIEIILARLTEYQTSIIVAEAEGGGLKSMWRPITMLTFVAIIANNYIIYPYLGLFWSAAPELQIPADMWSLLKIGLGGYVVGRSTENIVQTLKK